MELQYHTQICTQVFNHRFSAQAVEIILKANHQQDGLLTGLVGHPEYHFDDNKFVESWQYVETQKEIVLATLAENQAIQPAWQAFGRMLHTIQDFYAHSNYVKLWLNQYSEGMLLELSEFNGLDFSLIHSPEIISAKVYYPLEALTYFEFFRPLLRPLLPEDSHANMNLDSPIMGEFFIYAMEGARQHSEYKTTEILNSLSNKELRRFLGNQ